MGCLALHQEKILLARRAIPPREGLWNLPAGYHEFHETVQEGAKRETWEETKARVNITRLFCVYDLPHAGQVYLHFLADMPEAEFACGEESSEVALFTPDEIPWDEIAFSSTTYALKQYLKYGIDNEVVHVGGLPKDWKPPVA